MPNFFYSPQKGINMLRKVVMTIFIAIVLVIPLLSGIHEYGRYIANATTVPAETATTQELCSEPLDQYLMKAHHHLNHLTRSDGYEGPALSALAWMEYYKICSERQRVESDRRITTDERP